MDGRGCGEIQRNDEDIQEKQRQKKIKLKGGKKIKRQK
jgi:hypothetical protein